MGQDYDDFRQSVEKVIADATTAAASDAERGDIRTLQFLLRELNQQISAGDWKRAADVKNRMQVALTRSRAVAADGPRRKAEQDRIDAERAQREERKQRERQRQDEKTIRALNKLDIMNRPDLMNRPSCQKPARYPLRPLPALSDTE